MIDKIYQTSLSLLTDLYQLTMANGYFKHNKHEEEAVFHLFFRKNPFEGGFAVACGLRAAIDYIQNFKFTADDLEYLAGLTGADGKALFGSEFLEYLGQLKFSGDIDAIEEGTLVFAHEPMMRIKAPIVLGQLLETPLLNIMNHQTLIATKATRVCLAAEGDPVMEFGLRRAQGIDGGVSGTYASYVGGVDSTSNVLAGKLFGIPVKGTHAHSWVMSFKTELEAFKAFAEAAPNNCILLVDTFDTIEGVKKAIQVAKEYLVDGHQLLGIRLDSGDLCQLSKQARELLDSAGLHNVKIVASNDLDEEKISELKRDGAKIDIWGVGTKLITAYDQPALGGVYKLSGIKNEKNEWEYKIKKSETALKVSNPGCLQVRRYQEQHQILADVIYNEFDSEFVDFHNLAAQRSEKIPHAAHQDLLCPIFRAGKLVYQIPTLAQTRQKSLDNFQTIKVSKLIGKGQPLTGLENKLHQLKCELLER